jgi:phosphate-selective porin
MIPPDRPASTSAPARAAGCLVLAALIGLVPDARAQSPESDLTAESGHLARSSSHFGLRDIGDDDLAAVRIEDAEDRFSAKFGLALLAGDWTNFEQDAASIRQVGVQEDEFEPRSIRLMARGHFELWRRWNYKISYEYNGFEWQPGEDKWAASDLSVSTSLGPSLGTLTLGKMKEPHAYELVGDAANLPHSERFLSPFFRSRNVGVQLTNPILEQRATWTVGWYNDWWVEGEDFGDSGNDFVGRVTALPVWADEGVRYLHLAASVRYYGADDDRLRYKGRPASNVADNYVDSGDVAGDHAWHTGLELLWNVRGYSLLAEYVTASLQTADGSDPRLSGYYLTAGWVLSGEHRPYDRKAGYARRVLPQRRWGAVELIGRIGRVDLDDGMVAGGTMDGWWAGVNWWATRRWKFSIGYGDIDLDRFEVTGNTKTLLSRVQWIF